MTLYLELLKFDAVVGVPVTLVAFRKRNWVLVLKRSTTYRFTQVSRQAPLMGDQYRVIRCPLGLVELWDHLAQNPSIANRVEVVEIQRQKGGFAFESLSPVVVPGEFLTTAQEFVGNGRPYHTFLKEYLPGAWLAEKSLIGAIKNMSGLQSFKWCREPPLIDSQLDGLKDDIWTALRSCETLRELHVLDAGDNEILDETEADSSLWMTFRPIQTSQVCVVSFSLGEVR